MQRSFRFSVGFCLGTLAFGLSAAGQSTSTNAFTGVESSSAPVVPLKALPVPGTSSTHPFTSFDISFTDPATRLMALSSRSSKAVALYDALFERPLGETPAIFAGIGVDNAHSGPDGVVIAEDEIFAGDYPSQVQVFSVRNGRANPVFLKTIPTGGGLRADEMDYDPQDRVVGVSNGDTDPVAQPYPFVSLISKDTLEITKKVYFDGTNGTPDASQGGIGSVLYDANTNKFLISIVQVGADVTAGEVDEMDPVSGAILHRFTGINNCQPAGMAQGPGDNVLVGCDPGFPAPTPDFTPLTYVINGRTGGIVAKITQVGGEDEVWYNPGDHRYYTGSRDFFRSLSDKAATPVLGVIDANTNQWIENVPTGANAHAVSANPVTKHIYVPLKNANPLCGGLPGCVEVYGYTTPKSPWVP